MGHQLSQRQFHNAFKERYKTKGRWVQHFSEMFKQDTLVDYKYPNSYPNKTHRQGQIQPQFHDNFLGLGFQVEV